MSSLLAFLLLVLSVRIHGQQSEGTCPPGGGPQCIIQTHNGFPDCSGGYNLQPVCVDGYCRCPNNPIRDPCTCLAIVGGCHIRQDTGNSVGIPTFEGQSQTTYSCVAVGSCNYDVHVISNYEGDGFHSHGVHNTGTTRVTIRVNGEVIRPIILVFGSHEPVNWILDIPSNVTIEKVLLSSSYLEDSFISGSVSRILEVERLSSLPLGDGSDIGGGRTDEMLQYLYDRFGPVASFSGSYRADSWTLNINPNTTCSLVTTAPPTTQTTTETSPDSKTVAAIVSTVLVILFIFVAISLCCVAIKRYNQKERTVVTHPRTYPSTTGTTVPLTQQPTAIAHPEQPPPPPAPKPTDPTLTIEPPPPYSSAVSFPSVPPSIPANYPPPPPFQENPSPLPLYTIQK